MQRVQIPAYTDTWMRGDRYGFLDNVTRMRADKIHASIRPRHVADGDMVEIAHVKLDKSGKTGRFILLDCNAI